MDIRPEQPYAPIRNSNRGGSPGPTQGGPRYPRTPPILTAGPQPQPPWPAARQSGTPQPYHGICPPPQPSLGAATGSRYATWSLISAFLFAPAGVIFGHLGYRRSPHPGQPGHRRAIAGLVLSYCVIGATVAALAVWGTTRYNTHTGAGAATDGAAGSALVPLPTTTSYTPPMVDPDRLDALLMTGQDLGALVATPLSPNGTGNIVPVAPQFASSLDRPECWPTYSVGSSAAYDPGKVRGFALADYKSDTAVIRITEAAAAFTDAGTAQATFDRYLASWRSCQNSAMNATLNRSNLVVPLAITDVRQHDNVAIISVEALNGSIVTRRAIGVKANILTDIMVNGFADTSQDAAPMIATTILRKVPL